MRRRKKFESDIIAHGISSNCTLKEFEKILIDRKYVDIKSDEFLNLDKKFDYNYDGYNIDITIEEDWIIFLDYLRNQDITSKYTIVLNLRYDYTRNVVIFLFKKTEDKKSDETKKDHLDENENDLNIPDSCFDCSLE